MSLMMFERIDRYFEVKDDRGFIEGLINFGEWREINLIYSVPDTIRGDHYHTNTMELFFILEGTIRVVVQKVFGGRLIDQYEEHHVKSGDAFIIPPMTNHTFFVQDESKWINALSIAMDIKSPDMHKTI